MMSDHEESGVREVEVPAKGKKGRRQIAEDVKLNGFDRSPGWHKKKNIAHMSHLENWVSLL
jgi:hypothetical protein